jgi:hypothetical protein
MAKFGGGWLAASQALLSLSVPKLCLCMPAAHCCVRLLRVLFQCRVANVRRPPSFVALPHQQTSSGASSCHSGRVAGTFAALCASCRSGLHLRVYVNKTAASQSPGSRPTTNDKR